MISVVIPTHESERTLVHTLAALVPGALAGLVREVIVADAGSQDETATVADVAGCRFLVQPGGARGARLLAAAATARADWLWFLPPGALPQSGWIEAVERFISGSDSTATAQAKAAVLRSRPRRSRLVEGIARTAAVLGAQPRPQQGLLIARRLYQQLGGHEAASDEPERMLLRKLGRRRIVMLDAVAGWRGQ